MLSQMLGERECGLTDGSKEECIFLGFYIHNSLNPLIYIYIYNSLNPKDFSFFYKLCKIGIIALKKMIHLQRLPHYHWLVLLSNNQN